MRMGADATSPPFEHASYVPLRNISADRTFAPSHAACRSVTRRPTPERRTESLQPCDPHSRRPSQSPANTPPSIATHARALRPFLACFDRPDDRRAEHERDEDAPHHRRSRKRRRIVILNDLTCSEVVPHELRIGGTGNGGSRSARRRSSPASRRRQSQRMIPTHRRRDRRRRHR